MLRKFAGFLILALLLVSSGNALSDVSNYNSAASNVGYKETYTLFFQPTLPNSRVNVLVPADATVESVTLTNVVGSYNTLSFLYQGTFSMRCYKFAEINLALDSSSWPLPILNFNVTVNRNAAQYFPVDNDTLADTVMKRMQANQHSTNFTPDSVYLNLDHAADWRGYPVLPVNKKPGYQLPGQDFNYIIVASSDKQSMLATFISVKEQQDFQPYFESVEDINQNYLGDNIQAKAVEFLKDAFNAWHMNYVLFVGNTAIPPIPYVAYDFNIGAPINDSRTCDYYYTTLEQPQTDYSFSYPYRGGMDFPDFVLGRFPFDDATQIQNLIDKTINYEVQSDPGDWARKNLVVKGEGNTGSGWNVDLYTTNDRPRDYLISSSNLTLQSFVDEVNSGVGSVVVLAHGNPAGFDFGVEPFSYLSVDLLNNTKLPVLFTCGCHTGKFDVTYGSVASALLAKQDAGIVAMVSGSSFTPYGHMVYLSAYDYWDCCPYAERRIPNASYEIGKAFYYFSALNPVEYMNLLGDPSLMLATANYDLELDPEPIVLPIATPRPSITPSPAPTTQHTTSNSKSTPSATQTIPEINLGSYLFALTACTAFALILRSPKTKRSCSHPHGARCGN